MKLVAGVLLLAVTALEIDGRGIDKWIPTRVASCTYPTLALQARISGEVELEVNIDKNGTVKNERSLSGNRLLVNAAKTCIADWRFRYMAKDQVDNANPGTALFRVSIRFVLVGQLEPTQHSFVYEVPDRIVVSAVPPHWQP